MALKWSSLDDSQKSVALYCYNYLINSGLSPAGACGVLGNMYSESSFEVSAHTPNDEGLPASGLCQWRGQRRTDMMAYCEAHGGNWKNNIDGQLGFLVAELTDRQYMSNSVMGAGSSVIQTMQSINNSYDAAVYWEDKFERSQDDPDNRGKNANACYDAIVVQGEWKNAPAVSTQPKTVSAGEAIAAVALAEYDKYVESNKAYIERNGIENHNIYTEWAGDGNVEWCAIFCSYCVDQAGVSWPVQQTQTKYGFASANSDIHQPHGVAGAAYNGGVFLDRDQFNQWRVGDIVCFDWGHVGIIVEIGTNYIVTIEGNGDNEGVGPSFGVTGWSGGEENHDDIAKRTMYVGDYRFNRIIGVMSFSGVADVALPSGSNLSYASASTISSNQNLSDITYKEVQVDIKSSHIATADADANTLRTKSNSLLDTPTLVESPFIILKIGNYTFGSYSTTGSFEDVNSSIRVTYPNYMNSIRITKVNGQVNQYIITIIYQIENGNDPNLLDKIFSSVGYGTVYISYGDWNAPKFAYRDEEAIITRLDSNVDFSNSRITYTLYCTSNALMLMGGFYNFGPGNVKPSDEIYKMMYAEENKYHLQEIFTAFKGNEAFFRKCVASDDVVVEVVPKIGMDALSYVNYLVTCMSPTTTPKGSPIRDANYYLTICEDRETGTYFTVKKVSSTADIISLNNSDVYEVDVGYPGDTLVTQFKINSDNSWDLLYQYSDNIRTQDYIYNIDAQGQIYESYSPNITTSATYLRTTETQRNWWTQMTQFPITAILTIKGLLRPAMLMSYVRINAMFYGMRHVSSGLYLIVKQEDTVDMSGYRTTLTLQRIAGDLDTIVTETRTVTKLVPQFSHDINPRRSSNNRTTYQDIMEHVQEDVEFMERAEEEGLGSFVDKTQILYDQNTINENIAWAVDQMQQGIDPSENLRGSMPQLADEILDYIHYDEWRKNPESWSPPNVYGYKTSDSSQSKTLRALQDAVDEISGTIVGTNSGG